MAMARTTTTTTKAVAAVTVNGGQMVTKVGTEARHDIEKLLGCKVFLELRVRVEPQWRRNANIIQRLGYGEQE